jgi:DNA polymerase-3 subunit delta
VTVAKKEGFFVDCASLDAKRLASWVRARAKTKGHALEPDVAELLSEISGPDLATLDDALERLALYVGKDNPIGEEAVAACVTRVRLADTWKLVDAASTKDLGKVLALFADVYDPRDRGLPLVGAIAWSLRQLLKLDAALKEGASLDEAARRAGIYPTFRAREHAQKLKAFRPRELERWLVVVQETDMALKSSRRSADAILEEMFARLCSKRFAA